MEEKKSTYKTGLTLLHSHRKFQVAEKRVNENGVSGGGGHETAAGILNRTPRNRNNVKVAYNLLLEITYLSILNNVCNEFNKYEK